MDETFRTVLARFRVRCHRRRRTSVGGTWKRGQAHVGRRPPSTVRFSFSAHDGNHDAMLKGAILPDMTHTNLTVQFP